MGVLHYEDSKMMHWEHHIKILLIIWSYFVWVCKLVCTLRVEHRLRVFDTRVLREIFGSELDKVMGVEKIA
jgi:hypothetical protein